MFSCTYVCTVCYVMYVPLMFMLHNYMTCTGTTLHIVNCGCGNYWYVRCVGMFLLFSCCFADVHFVVVLCCAVLCCAVLCHVA